MDRLALTFLIATSIGLGGCSTFNKLTGKNNDTVLPGQREEILPPDQYRAKSDDLQPQGSGSATTTAPTAPPPAAKSTAPAAPAECDPEADPSCVQPDSGANKGIFNDG